MLFLATSTTPSKCYGCASAGNERFFFFFKLVMSPGTNQKQNFPVFLSGKDGTLCGLLNWQHLQGFSSQRWDRPSCEAGGVHICCRATCWKLLEDAAGKTMVLCLLLGVVLAVKSVESLVEHCSISGSIANPMQRLQFLC